MYRYKKKTRPNIFRYKTLKHDLDEYERGDIIEVSTGSRHDAIYTYIYDGNELIQMKEFTVPKQFDVLREYSLSYWKNYFLNPQFWFKPNERQRQQIVSSLSLLTGQCKGIMDGITVSFYGRDITAAINYLDEYNIYEIYDDDWMHASI